MSQKTSALVMGALCFILALSAVIMTAGRGEKEITDDVSLESAAPAVSGETITIKETPKKTEQPVPTPEHNSVVERQSGLAPVGYFSDAVFIGSSAVTGLDLYDYDDLLAGADFYTADDMTVSEAEECVQEAEAWDYGKVYIGLGLDEMNNDRDALRYRFNALLDTVSERDPGCVIYLMSVTPVSKYKSENSSTYTKDLAESLNEMLREIAEERGAYYLDVFSVLSNEEGYLPSEVTVDGIHFTPAHYEAWFDLLVSYYVPVKTAAAVETEIPA